MRPRPKPRLQDQD